SLQDHAAGLEVHAARVPRPIRVRARSAGHRLVAQAPQGRLLDRYRPDHRQGGARAGGVGGGGARLGSAQGDFDRTLPLGPGRAFSGISEPARGAARGGDRPRYQLHRDIWLGDCRRGPAKTAHEHGARTSEPAALGGTTIMKRKGLVICALAMSAAAVAGAAWGQGADQGLNSAIATGGTGGVYYPLGGGMANVLSKNVPGVQATARVTGGSVDNLKLIGSQQSEVALVMVDAALDALR